VKGTCGKPIVIGFDTSNYRTSLAAVTLDGEILVNHRELLPVPEGERGLRQGDAVFAHVRQLRNAEKELRGIDCSYRIAATAASTKPADGEKSYMPVFQAGHTAGCLLAASLDVPFYETTHQRGHLAAALHGTGLEWTDELLAVHLSGGTTDLLVMNGEQLERIGGSADLHAGQLVDRAGVSMGFGFPSGGELEKLALHGKSEGRLGCSMEEGDLICHLSGAETRVQQWIREKALSREDIAREIYDFLARTIVRMLRAGTVKTGITRALITGGVASSDLLRLLLEERRKKTRGCPEVAFGMPEMSGDNAVGVALIGARKYIQQHSS
jgi:N6-L-threonylcarbamoyladenine synthase